MKNIYYVYVYLDPMKQGDFTYGIYHFNNEPFYIGKGSNGRDRMHLKGKSHNKEFKERIELIKENTGINPQVIRLWEDLTEEDAKSIEWKAIKEIGTLYSSHYKGPLLNKAFTNVYDITLFGNTTTKTYILNHVYVGTQKVIMGHHRLEHHCEIQNMDIHKLENGEIVNGWTLDII